MLSLEENLDRGEPGTTDGGKRDAKLKERVEDEDEALAREKKEGTGEASGISAVEADRESRVGRERVEGEVDEQAGGWRDDGREGELPPPTRRGPATDGSLQQFDSSSSTR